LANTLSETDLGEILVVRF